MNNTGEIHILVQREVAQLHQSIGGLLDRIESLEKQKECLIKVGAEKSSNFNVLKDKFYALQEFKQKYFTNNFYWVNENNHQQLQDIAIEVGCLCHTMKKDTIKWHEGFKNLGFRTYEKNNNVTVFQKEPFLLHNQTATNFDEMLSVYDNVATCV